MTKKERILLAAHEQFGEHGYTATTLKMVADHAGVASGLVSHYYGNKDNLFLEAGGELIDQMLAVLSDKAKAGKNGLEALGIFVEAYFDFTAANRTTFPTLLRSSPFSDEYPHLDRTHIAGKFKRLIDRIEEYLIQGMADGSVREVTLPHTSFLVYGHIVGAVRTEFLTPYEVPGLFEEACQFIVRSVAKK
ncbi:TetR/AcrR family transcriptional regulator [Maridesulfovibrio hydrothermalis]|uniref:Transcriptional regulator, TetR family n=1 Tax=Maridesulfovibrio hydrothermalis AM13 = DSM 14728 TaxID=1121451 RepID=L0R8C8_9BACT|nr:TetR/AcrR family transcriptional regulator [Maridesulfovibrio hydrothermalis]CCO22472.1 Transcriptional regulator, TetR family [Maridesulfovibrio hydrothermalis AM13 = DSM 14728]